MRRGIFLLVLAAMLVCGHAHGQQSGPQWWDVNALGTTAPSGRLDPAMAPFPPTGEVLLFGGTETHYPYPNTYLNDTWAWTEKGWIKKELTQSPPAFKWVRMVYDSKRQRIVLAGLSIQGGNYGPTTWVWDGQAWSALGYTPGADRVSLAFNQATGEVVLFGGTSHYPHCGSDDTWVLGDGNQWHWVGGSNPPQPPLAASTAFASPPGRTSAAMAYDHNRGQVVLHGGVNACTGERLRDTWVWDGSASGWTQVFPGESPPAVDWRGRQFAYYAASGYLLLAGCITSDVYCEPPTHLWKWTGSTWEQVPQPPPGPSGYLPPYSEFGFGWSEVPFYDGLLMFGGDNPGCAEPTSDYCPTWAWGLFPEVLNTAPVAVISDLPEEIPCISPSGAQVVFDGSKSNDAQSDPLTFQWSGPFGSLFGPVVSAVLPIGQSAVTLTVSDGRLDGTATASPRVTVGVAGLDSPLGPLVRSDAAPPPTAAFEAGRTLPLKLQLSCGGRALTSVDTAPPRLVAIALISNSVSGTLAAISVEPTADTGGVFRSENTKWIYNLSTKGLAPGSYQIVIEMPDGLRYRTAIALR